MPTLYKTLLDSTIQTIAMTALSSIFSFFLGLILGILLFISAPKSLKPNVFLYQILSAIIDAWRAIPFIILAFYLLPITRIIVGRGTGLAAVIFILSITATPFYARMAQLAFHNVEKSLIHATNAMGAKPWQILFYVILPESYGNLTSSFTILVISILSATSLAGYLGGGGLGDMAIRFGYQRYEPKIMTAVIIIMVLLNILVQLVGNKLTNMLNYNKK